jgi:DNA-binding IclR family transcriptional regulator
VHRLATTADGLLEQSPENRRYRLGIELFAMGAFVRRRLDLSKRTLSFLHELREKTGGETIYLATLDRTNIVCLYFLGSDRAIRTRSYMGRRKPAFCTSEGMVLFAHREPDSVTRVIKGRLEPRKPKTNRYHTETDNRSGRTFDESWLPSLTKHALHRGKQCLNRFITLPSPVRRYSLFNVTPTIR